ncbi:hypothetical protein F5I97DRAFT_2075575 [Phlebopus sp. FC_14]|nr:hypothetical protein F5I97DRAFT_2075575 [Phlebopus sp. FC_14]
MGLEDERTSSLILLAHRTVSTCMLAYRALIPAEKLRNVKPDQRRHLALKDVVKCVLSTPIESSLKQSVNYSATRPHYGAGAGQAIEEHRVSTNPQPKDAFILGRLLAHTGVRLSQAPAALGIYQDIRLPFTSWVAREFLRTGWMYLFMSPGYYDGTRDTQVDKQDGRGVGEHERRETESLQDATLKQWE